MHIFIRSFLTLFLGFISGLTSISSAVPQHGRHIPPDSFFVLSIKAKNIIEKSLIKNSLTWSPIINDWGMRNPSALEFLIDVNSSGVNLNQPIHFFSRLHGIKNPDPIIGMVASVKDQTMADSFLQSFAESLKVEKKPSPFLRFGNEVLPYEFGRRGALLYFIAVIKTPSNSSGTPNDVYLDEVIKFLPKKFNKANAPDSLTTHLSNLKDCSLYLDGSGLGRLAESFWPTDQWRNVLPLIEPLMNRSIGLYTQTRQGNLEVEIKSLTENNDSMQTSAETVSKVIGSIPGDSPFIAKLNFDPEKIIKLGNGLIDQTLKAFSNGQLDLSYIIPGLGLSVKEILDSPSGQFVLGIGSFNALVYPPSEIIPMGKVQLNPILIGALGIENNLTRRKIAIGLDSSSLIGSLMKKRGVEVFEKKNNLWFYSPEYKRELDLSRTLRTLAKSRKEFLDAHSFAVDAKILPLTQSIRRNRNLPYNYYKALDRIENIANMRISSKQNGLVINFRFHDKKTDALTPIFDFIGQEIIDRRNALLYRAIAENDYNGLQQAIKVGALVNANDHFGHSPLHYASYKGNAGFVDFLLRNGGDPNAKSQHLSTPLHSAAWGRNLKVAELLLEDGADVNAKTDEGETPAMTAALRGEKALLETLFSLSADPHAKDIHGSNLYDLASAGGHIQILNLLDNLKVKNNHPFHSAAGRGDLKAIKKMLKNGRKINERDAFGATPLIIATVSGKIEIVTFLLNRKADPQLTAKDGYSMMHAAAFSGKKELVQLAYNLGLDVNARYGKDGVTPVDVGEDASDALPYLQSLGGRRGWELGRYIEK